MVSHSQLSQAEMNAAYQREQDEEYGRESARQFHVDSFNRSHSHYRRGNDYAEERVEMIAEYIADIPHSRVISIYMVHHLPNEDPRHAVRSASSSSSDVSLNLTIIGNATVSEISPLLNGLRQRQLIRAQDEQGSSSRFRSVHGLSAPPNSPIERNNHLERRTVQVHHNAVLRAIQDVSLAPGIAIEAGGIYGQEENQSSRSLPSYQRQDSRNRESAAPPTAEDSAQEDFTQQTQPPGYAAFVLAEDAVPSQSFNAKFIVKERLSAVLEEAYGAGNTIMVIKDKFIPRLFRAPAYSQTVEIHNNPALGDVEPLTKREIEVCRDRPDSTRKWLFRRFFTN